MSIAGMPGLETITQWTALIFYLFSSVLFIYSAASRSEGSVKAALWLAFAGLAAHSVSLGVRWHATGHGPYLMKSEEFSAAAWVAMAMFLLFAFRSPALRNAGVLVLPVCLAVMVFMSSRWFSGFLHERLVHAEAANMSGHIIRPPATFNGIWFAVHVSAATVSPGAVLISLAASMLYLVKTKRSGSRLARRLPAPEAIDEYSYRFAGLGFISWTVMTIAGAMWAERAWGSYWGWDPIETWSLITWLLLGLYLHLRRFHGWGGEKAAWLMALCFTISVLTAFALPFVVKTIHTEYMF